MTITEEIATTLNALLAQMSDPMKKHSKYIVTSIQLEAPYGRLHVCLNSKRVIVPSGTLHGQPWSRWYGGDTPQRDRTLTTGGWTLREYQTRPEEATSGG